MVFADGRKHELNVSTYQMAILMLFNEADRLSYVDIAEATQIPPADLKRSLQSLACVKVCWRVKWRGFLHMETLPLFLDVYVVRDCMHGACMHRVHTNAYPPTNASSRWLATYRAKTCCARSP